MTDEAVNSSRKRLTLALMPGLIAFSMGQTVLFAVAGPAFREVGLSESQLGVIISAAAVCSCFLPRSGAASPTAGDAGLRCCSACGRTRWSASRLPWCCSSG